MNSNQTEMLPIENEVKFLDINADTLIARLNELKAKKVFEGERVFVIFDTIEQTHFNAGNEIRLTLEGSGKLSYEQLHTDGTKASYKIKLDKGTTLEHVSAFFQNLNLIPVFKITSRRVSYELDGVDIDIDWFPELSPFVELDISESDKELPEVVEMLGLQDYENVRYGTRQIYENKGLSYDDLFRIGE